MEMLDGAVKRDDVRDVRCIKIDCRDTMWPFHVVHAEPSSGTAPSIFCGFEKKNAIVEVDAFLSAVGYGVWRLESKPFAVNHTPKAPTLGTRIHVDEKGYLAESVAAVDMTAR